MLTKQMYLIGIVFRKLGLLVVVVGWVLSQTASADIVGFWEFEDAAEGVIKDSSGNGYNGMIVGGAEVVADPVRGQVLRNVAGGSIDLFNVPKPIPAFAANSSVTLAAWVKLEAASTSNYSYVIQLGANGDNPIVSLGIGTDGRVRSYSETDQPGGNADQVNLVSDSVVEEGAFANWHHIAVVYDRVTDTGKFYIDGLADSATIDISLLEDGYAFTWPTVHFGANQDNDTQYIGLMDDAAIFDHALTEAEIQKIMQGYNPELAGDPQPADAFVGVPRDMTLSWEPGEFAVTHDVYFGTSFDDVNAASRDVPLDILLSQGQADSTYDPGRLEFGQTYYWRIDEVNGAPDYTIYKGKVWNFTVEPEGYPIQGVVATTNGTSAMGQEIGNIVDGSGLDADDLHSYDGADMWLADPAADGTLWAQFEFDGIYKLHQMLIWNYNVQFETILNLGVKDVTVEYSTDGVDWTVLGDEVLGQGIGAEGYAANTTIDFDGAAVKYVKFTINDGFGDQGQYGLSEVRFLSIPAYASEPEPADGATDVSVDSSLSWRAGRGVASHELYLGSDPEDLPLIASLQDSAYETPDLNLGTTYYWQIVEVNDPEAWAGDLWTFSTQEFVLIDDFESYEGDDAAIAAGTAVWQTWLDGIEDAANGGSQTGYDEGPFVEQTVVHGGSQSMPLLYNNSDYAFSQAAMSFDTPQDWTASGIQTLTVFFRGQEGNTGQLYVEINGVRVSYDGAASDITKIAWQQWNIDLAGVGTNLSSVQTLAVGIDGSGAAGTLLFDDIRLYRQAPIALREPDTANLVAYYAFDGDATDSSGNGHDGQIQGDAAFVDGIVGQAVELDGVDNFVRIADADALNPGEGAYSFTFWAQLDYASSGSGAAVWDLAVNKRQTGSNGYYIGANRDQGSAEEAGYKFMVGSTSASRVDTGYQIVPLGEWVFVAAVLDRDQDVHKISVNGGASWSTATPPTGPIAPAQDLGIGFDIGLDDYWFHGLIDELRLYNTALTDAEVAWLANDL